MDHHDAWARQRYAQLAALVLTIAAAYEGLRLALGVAWPPWVPAASYVIQAVLVALWLGTALCLMLRKRSARFTTISWPLSVFAVLAAVTHAVFIFAFSQKVMAGFAYLIIAGITGFFVKRSFDRGLFRHGRDLDPSRV